MTPEDVDSQSMSHFFRMVQFSEVVESSIRAEIHSLKLTAKAPENGLGPKRTRLFQPSIFRGYVSFREGKMFAKLAVVCL